MIIFGTRGSRIGSLQMAETQCDYCEQQHPQEITQFGQYFHIFWIPVFPMGRRTFAECTHCKRTLRKKEFSQRLKENFINQKSTIKRPLWHWSGILLILGLMLAFSILNLFQIPS